MSIISRNMFWNWLMFWLQRKRETIVNLDNTSGNDLGCSCLDYYKKNQTSIVSQLVLKKNICPVCWENPIEIGAHVGKMTPKDLHAYIIPLCKDCNKKEEEMRRPLIEMVAIPRDTPNYSSMRYPKPAIAKIKKLACGALDQWDGSPQ